MSSISSSPDARKEESKRPQFVTIQIKRGGKLKKQKLNLDFPGDRSIWVSSLENLPPGPRATLRLLVVEFYNVQRQDVFPSCSTIARHTGLSREAVTRHLKILRKQGLISPVGKTRRGVVIYKVHIHGLLKEVNPSVDEKTKTPDIPAWLKRNNKIMAHWRGIYNGENTEQDLKGMPEWVAVNLFEEGREEYWETRVENPVDKGNLGVTKRHTYPLTCAKTSHLPVTKRHTNRKGNRKEELTELFLRTSGQGPLSLFLLLLKSKNQKGMTR